MFNTASNEDIDAMMIGYYFLCRQRMFNQAERFTDSNNNSIGFRLRTADFRHEFVYCGQKWAQRGIIQMPLVLLSHAQRHGYPVLFYVKEDRVFYIFRDVKRIMDWGVQKYDKSTRLKVMKFEISYGRKYVFTEDEQTNLESFTKA